jgi:hypothetical protein
MQEVIMTKYLATCLFSLLVAASGSAVADTGAALAPITLGQVPRQCREVSPIPRSSRVVSTAFNASISTANCMAELAMNKVVATNTDESIAALDAAVRPSIAMLDAIIVDGDPGYRIMAEYAKADLYQALAVRMRNTIPRSPTGLTGEAFEAAVDGWQRSHADLEHKIEPWLVQSDLAYDHVARIGAQNPAIVALNPVLVHDVQIAHDVERPGVASR